MTIPAKPFVKLTATEQHALTYHLAKAMAEDRHNQQGGGPEVSEGEYQAARKWLICYGALITLTMGERT